MRQLTILAAFFLSTSLTACSGATGNDSKNDSSASSAGGDMYYEYTITSKGKDININGYTKLYLSSSGDARSEMDMSNSAMKTKPSSPIVLIGHSDKPTESILIDDEKKTYTINHFSPDSLGINMSEKIQSTVTKIGTEKILGFNSVHARIISNRSIGSFYKDIDTVDIWRSDEMPMLGTFKKLMKQFEGKTGNYLYSPAAMEQLKQMGCDGFIVRLEIRSKTHSLKEELTKVEHRDLPKNIFQIPAGYTEDKNGL